MQFESTIFVWNTTTKAHERVTVVLNIDVDKVAYALGRKAKVSKRNKSVALDGAIQCEVKK